MFSILSYNNFIYVAEIFLYILFLYFCYIIIKSERFLEETKFFLFIMFATSLIFLILEMNFCFMISVSIFSTILFQIYLVNFNSILHSYKKNIINFSKNIKSKKIWISDIIKTFFYAENNGCSLVFFIYLDDNIINIKNINFILDMPLNYDFLKIIINGSESKNINIFCDKIGHIRYINTYLQNINNFNETITIFFEKNNRLFKIIYKNTINENLSPGQAVIFLEKILLNN
jgi:hypothetical protein